MLVLVTHDTLDGSSPRLDHPDDRRRVAGIVAATRVAITGFGRSSESATGRANETVRDGRDESRADGATAER